MTKPTEVTMQSKNNELANVASLLENLQQLSMNNSSIAASPCHRHSPLPHNRLITTILELIAVCYFLTKLYPDA